MGGQNDEYRAGKAPKQAQRMAGRTRGASDKNTDYSYGQGPRGGDAFDLPSARSPKAGKNTMQSAFNQANQGGRDPHSDGGYGAQPELRGQAKEDHRRQENRVNQQMHSSGSGIPAHEYEPTPPAGKVP